jgi:hypothetical protein
MAAVFFYLIAFAIFFGVAAIGAWLIDLFIW